MSKTRDDSKFQPKPLKQRDRQPKTGDAMVVPRPNGTTDMLLLGHAYPRVVDKARSGDTLSDEEIGFLDAASKAMPLVFVAKSPHLLLAIEETMEKSGIFNPDDLAGVTTIR